MAAVPVTIQCMIYPRDKSGDPYPATIVGFASITGLEVGGGPVIPPPGIEVPPDLGIWPNPPEGIAPHPEHPIVIPPPGGPDVPPPEEIPDPPAPVAKPGWNWAPGWSQWIWCYIPGSGQAQPKKK